MSALIALRAAFGQDEASHGLVRYRVGIDGVLFVPPTVARYLVHTGGFHVTEGRIVRSLNPSPPDVQPPLQSESIRRP